MAVAADKEGQSRVAAFRKALRELGWNEGKDLQIVDRWTAGEAGLRQKYAAEIVGLAPNVILVNGLLPLKALLEPTRSIPIVFVQVSDPVGSGFVPSMARPGGHITGFTHFESATAGKWLELLKELAPNVRRVAVMCAPQDPAFPGYLEAIENVAPLHGVHAIASGVSDAGDAERHLRELAREPNGGIIVLPSPTTTVHRQHIIANAALHRLPAIYLGGSSPTKGALFRMESTMSISIVEPLHTWSNSQGFERWGSAGPVTHQISSSSLNLKTAKALSITIPQSILLRANEAIE